MDWIWRLIIPANKLSQYLATMNPPQLEAVSAEKGPLLILAGAGSGKTRVIIGRIAWLLEEKGVDPASILAVTFTNKAAHEMRERLDGLSDYGSNVMVRTFHSFGAWFLRRHAGLIAYSPSFSIYDTEDSLSLLKRLRPELSKNERKTLFYAISRAKDQALLPDEDLSAISSFPELAENYTLYEEALSENNAFDFGDLVFKTLLVLEGYEEVAARFKQRFEYILVDEYQDSNPAQFFLLQALYSPENSLCVVGDDDQSIYAFRGAEIENILQFPHIFKGSKIIKLEQNYRSTASILNAASELMTHNEGRMEKRLWTDKPKGQPPSLHLLDNEEAEALFCAQILQQKNYQGSSAVVYRTNAQSRVFETCFRRLNIAYKLIGSIQFFEREEVKDVLALLRLLANPADLVAFSRIINKPSRGIGPKSIEKLLQGRQERANLLELAQSNLEDLSARASKSAKAFLKLYQELEEKLPNLKLAVFIKLLCRESGIYEYYASLNDQSQGDQKTANIEELVNMAASYPQGREGLLLFLQQTEIGENQNIAEEDRLRPAVSLITLHNTKGLEFDRVFICGLEEGLFPRESIDGKEEEEERRLFYVGITRAKKELYLLSARSRFRFGQRQISVPSRFLNELPQNSVDRSAMPGASSEQNGMQAGQRVYHDDFGSGTVIKVIKTAFEDGLLVHFDSGLNKRFIGAFSRLEKIAGEEL